MPLVNALSPDVELEGCLLRTLTSTKIVKVLDQAVVNAFNRQGTHLDSALESLAHANGIAADGVLSFVDQVEDLNNNWVFEERLHVHLVHDIKTVHPLSHVKNRFKHELVKRYDVVLLLEV